MTRMTEQDRTRYATRPDDIPRDVQCDCCDRVAVARGTDGVRAFAYCADDMMAKIEQRRAAPRVSAQERSRAILKGMKTYWSDEIGRYVTVPE
jgi:hypothetical protein